VGVVRVSVRIGSAVVAAWNGCASDVTSDRRPFEYRARDAY